ncbi:MAG TPA: hypothetical protein DEA26_09135 [Oceanospirillales bacterium]|nr:hypothetical protein [Oceanospirillaceae bacterium]HBS42831.1 hypothetical protein [Oceanospirillales bacterium]|tara:strand:- start:2158 stop:2424 length:267 start_codon:yes stop_codon:yes gene_type:complete
MDAIEVQNRIKTELRGSHVIINGADCSFSVQVISQAFADMRPVLRQQKILQLFSNELSTGELHALTVDARTPLEVAPAQQGGLTTLTV